MPEGGGGQDVAPATDADDGRTRSIRKKVRQIGDVVLQKGHVFQPAREAKRDGACIAVYLHQTLLDV